MLDYIAGGQISLFELIYPTFKGLEELGVVLTKNR